MLSESVRKILLTIANLGIAVFKTQLICKPATGKAINRSPGQDEAFRRCCITGVKNAQAIVDIRRKRFFLDKGGGRAVDFHVSLKFGTCCINDELNCISTS